MMFMLQMDCAEAVEAVLSLELDFEEKPLIMSKYCVPDAAKSTSPSAEVLLQGVPGPLLFEVYLWCPLMHNVPYTRIFLAFIHNCHSLNYRHTLWKF